MLHLGGSFAQDIFKTIEDFDLDIKPCLVTLVTKKREETIR